jgi:hypothetical protein
MTEILPETDGLTGGHRRRYAVTAFVGDRRVTLRSDERSKPVDFGGEDLSQLRLIAGKLFEGAESLHETESSFPGLENRLRAWGY